MGYGLIAMVLGACSMPSLETGSNLLTMPPGGNEPAAAIQKTEAALAVQSSDAQTEAGDPVLLGAVSQDSQTGDASPSAGKAIDPMPADGIMRGQFWGSSVAFADPDGLVCAGRLLRRGSELNQGLSVPVNCSDGSIGRVKIISFASPDEAEAVLLFDGIASSPVSLVRSAALQ